jgi:phosphoglycerate dehydrogenase-like enzyme
MAGQPYFIVMADPQPAEQAIWLQGLADPLGLRVQAPVAEDEAELKALLAQAEGMIFQRRVVTAEILTAAPHLRVIQKMGGRRDKIDISAARARGIAVALMPMPGSVAVAEHAMTLLLACAKRLLLAHRLTATGAYRDLGIEPKVTTERSHGFQWMKMPDLVELAGLTLGIFGFGDIGNEIAKRARAFDMQILYHKRNRLEADLEAELGVAYADKDDLLRRSDFVVMTSPLTPETEKSIGARELALMQPTAYLINVSRGGVIEEEALVQALLSRQIAGAGLDVFVQEPIPHNHPLLSLDSVILTPHIAGGKGGARERQAVAILTNLKRFVDGQPLQHRIV